MPSKFYGRVAYTGTKEEAKKAYEKHVKKAGGKNKYSAFARYAMDNCPPKKS